ncbi:immunoglobulin iota chain [Labeo rohita]|nr:immunoglobulin iota chain [Labeo rohita]
MKIIQLHFYLLMWSQATESLTNIAVTLGADVNITSKCNVTEINWYRQKSPDPSVFKCTCNSTSVGAKDLLMWSQATEGLLNITVTLGAGLVKCCLDATRRSKDTSEKPQSTTAAQNTNDPQYAEVHFIKRRSRNRPCEDETTYSVLQPVKTV